MKRSMIAGMAAIQLLVLGFAGETYAQVYWETGPSAVIAGSGCRKNVDAFLLANGPDLSIVLTRLDVSLPGGGPNRSLAGNSFCAARVPVTLDSGVYIGRLTQTLTVGATKSDWATLDAGVRGTFFNLPVKSVGIHRGEGWGTAITSSQLTGSVYDDFGVSAFCGRNPRGLYQVNFSAAGQRRNDRESVLVGIQTLDVRLDVIAEWFRC